MKLKAFLLTLFFIHSFLHACDVPVFRYALERWERDLYRLFVVHQRKLNEKESELLQQLNNNSLPNIGHTNYRLYDVDLNHEKIKGFNRWKGFFIKNFDTKLKINRKKK